MNPVAVIAAILLRLAARVGQSAPFALAGRS
jgi:hypothetical protein